MKTTLAVAFVFFMLYLSGCDFLAAEPEQPDLAPLKEQLGDPTVAGEEEEDVRSFYAPLSDTVKKGGR